MSKLKGELVQACAELGLQVDIDFLVDLGDGHLIQAVARIRNIGLVNGMLVVSEYDRIRKYAEDIVNAGYGYSVLSEPQAGAEFDLESYSEMFSDWGWSGIEDDRSH